MNMVLNNTIKNYIREKGLNTMSTEEIAKLINENSQRVTVIPIRCNQRVPSQIC